MTHKEQATRKCYSADNETFNHNDFGDLLDSCDLQVGDTYWMADAVPLSHANFIRVDRFLEQADDLLSDEFDEFEDGKSNYSDASDEAKAELKALIEAWATKHVALPYWRVANVVKCKITAEDLA
jgi:hypothetical protein